MTPNSNSALIKVTLIVSALFFSSSSIIGQLVPSIEPMVWLKPDKQVLDSLHIGNYPVLNLEASDIREAFDKVAQEPTGTLFMVLRTLGDTVGESIIQIGSNRIFEDKVLIAGKSYGISPLGEKSNIVRLTYQGRPGRRNLGRVKILPEVEIAEVIFYKGIIEDEEARIVESYLAMKYSINITENKDPNLRDYIDVNSYKAWNSQIDEDYNKEVLSLGRLDTIGWYQSQTYTADEESIRLSLSPSNEKGEMPNLAIQDGSLLLLSTKDENAQRLDCGEAPNNHIWKFKLIDWHSEEDKLYVRVDSVWPGVEKAILTNGVERLPLKVENNGQQMFFTIPLPGGNGAMPPSGQESEFYLSFINEIKDCERYCNVQMPDCLGGQNEVLRIDIAPEALPAVVRLVHIDSETILNEEVATKDFEIQNLMPGHYRLYIEGNNPNSADRENLRLADEVFVIESCNGGSMIEPENALAIKTMAPEGNILLAEGSGNIENSKGGAGANGANASAADDRGFISAYPNPGTNNDPVHFFFENLSDRDFDITIVDSKGKILSQHKFTPTAEKPVFNHHFKYPGPYIIRFTDGNFIDIQHLVIY